MRLTVRFSLVMRGFRLAEAARIALSALLITAASRAERKMAMTVAGRYSITAWAR